MRKTTFYTILILQLFITLTNAQNYDGCLTYYTSKGKLCCNKGTTQNPIEYCPTTVTNTESTINTCTSYKYVENIKCCEYQTTFSSGYTAYTTYCPTIETLTSLCPKGCCIARVPVETGHTIVYYNQHFCPDLQSEPNTTAYVCAIIVLASVSAISITIAVFIFYHRYKQKSKNQTVVSNTEFLPTYEEAMSMEILPPNIPGYTFNNTQVNTGCLVVSNCQHETGPILQPGEE